MDNPLTTPYDPETVRKAQFWKQTAQYFTTTVIVVILAIVIGVLSEVLTINQSIKKQISTNLSSRNTQLQQIEQSLTTLHNQSNESRSAYNSYLSCVIVNTAHNVDVQPCDNLKPKQ